MTNDAEEKPLSLRWERETRYYEARIEPDLWGGWVLTKIWGRRNSPMGQIKIKRIPCQSYEDAKRKLEAVEKQRTRRRYEPVDVKG